MEASHREVGEMSLSKRLLPALVGVAATGALASPVHAASSPPPASFATPTVVDNYRPGFEPDVAVDQSGSGSTYTSTPYGFSTTESFVYRSDDERRSFQLIEGNIFGKPATCVGGGDTELKIDPVNGNIFFVDLQGLTNFSSSVSTDRGASWSTTCDAVNGAGVDRQWLGIDTNGHTTPVGAGATGGRLYLDYDNVNQNTDLSDGEENTGGNQLVMNESLDGVHYGAQCQVAGVPCPLPPAVISADEGIPGNIVVDETPGSPFQHRVYAIHTGTAGKSVIVSYCSGKKGDSTAAEVAADCTDPTQVAVDPAHVNVNWHDSAPRAPGNYLTGNLFASIAIDRRGNLYAVWSEYPVDANGDENGPGAVKLAVSTDGAKTWSAPVQISPATLGNNVMPWVTAGDAGRIDVAWYGAPQTKNAQGTFGPDTLDAGTWNVYLAQSLNATTTKPTFTVTKVSDHQAKFGNISTQGLGGSPDRSLGDFMQVTTGTRGQAVVSYVDDTSADRNPDLCQCGQTSPEAAGPVMIATQTGGQSLFASVGTVNGPRPAQGSVTDPVGDGAFPFGGVDVKAPPPLDVSGASVTQPDAKHLTVTLSTADPDLAAHLAVSPELGGGVGEWIVRWAAPTYHGGPGDGNIFYVGMESASGGAPEFYTGTTGAIDTTHVKYFTYPKTTDIPGKITGNRISWTVPLTDVGSPAKGDGLFSVTGFTATQATPSPATAATLPNGTSLGDDNVPNTIDLTPPFGFNVG
jgi:hypothetical protein